MKRIVSVLCLGALVFFNLSSVYAQDKPLAPADTQSKNCSTLIDTAEMHYNKTPINKFGRGMANIATFYLEVPASMFKVSQEKGELLGFTVGFFQGIFTSLLRLTTGLYDTVTFVIPSYSKPLMQPEYATDSLEQACSDYDNSLPTAR